MKHQQAIANIAEICARHNLSQVVISPGSRNAPLTLAFSRHPDMNIRVIHDERSAGYIALGMAQATGKPVVLICTSGTAVLNYGPAVAEAFYQNVPLLVLTADRPPELIDQRDGQTIRQNQVFKPHVKESFVLPVAQDHPDVLWDIEWKTNQAILRCQQELPGPVHVNIPMREPLYPESNEDWTYKLQHTITLGNPVQRQLPKEQWRAITSRIKSSSRPLIVAGQFAYDPQLVMTLRDLSNYSQIPIIGDAVSNIQGIENLVKHIETIAGQNEKALSELQPDLIITYGQGVISKNLKLFLRAFPATEHIHIQPSGMPANTYKSLTEIVPVDPLSFFKRLARDLTIPVSQFWYQKWQEQERQAADFISTQAQVLGLQEMQAVQKVLEHMPEAKLHLANSMPVRWVDLLGVGPQVRAVWANRGTSGIDGCCSTAVGHALEDQHTQVLITGDMAFHYDRNAYWHNYPLPNLKIIILNNQGGGIFRLIEGPSSQPECEKYFVTRQQLTAKNTASDFGFTYLYAENIQELDNLLPQLFEKQEKACVLEINLPTNTGPKYRELKERIRNNYEQD